MIDFLKNTWYLWAIVLLVAVYRLFRPIVKGWFGEKTIALFLSRLPKEEYTILRDISLTTDTGTTQIDHIVVSLYGIFIIETKNYKGWIFGGEKSPLWTQNIYGKKKSFMNPLLQNYAHVKAVEARLGSYANVPILPIVAFSPNSDLKTKTTSHVVHFQKVNGVIREYHHKVIEPADIAAIVEIICNQDVTSSETRKEHIALIREKKAVIENAEVGGTCPKCSGILVERKGKSGRFIGCSNYPKCRFKKPIP